MIFAWCLKRVADAEITIRTECGMQMSKMREIVAHHNQVQQCFMHAIEGGDRRFRILSIAHNQLKLNRLAWLRSLWLRSEVQVIARRTRLAIPRGCWIDN